MALDTHVIGGSENKYCIFFPLSELRNKFLGYHGGGGKGEQQL